MTPPAPTYSTSLGYTSDRESEGGNSEELKHRISYLGKVVGNPLLRSSIESNLPSFKRQRESKSFFHTTMNSNEGVTYFTKVFHQNKAVTL